MDSLPTRAMQKTARHNAIVMGVNLEQSVALFEGIVGDLETLPPMWHFGRGVGTKKMPHTRAVKMGPR